MISKLSQSYGTGSGVQNANIKPNTVSLSNLKDHSSSDTPSNLTTNSTTAKLTLN